MDKSPDAFRTISEVAETLDTPAHVLRFWESRFPQIRPVKRAGGRRYYRPADVALLTGIKRLLHEEGLTIRGVQKILREQGVRHVAGLSGLSVSDLPVMDAAEALEAAMTERFGAGAEVLPVAEAETAQIFALETALRRVVPMVEEAEPVSEEIDAALPDVSAEAFDTPDDTPQDASPEGPPLDEALGIPEAEVLPEVEVLVLADATEVEDFAGAEPEAAPAALPQPEPPADPAPLRPAPVTPDLFDDLLPALLASEAAKPEPQPVPEPEPATASRGARLRALRRPVEADTLAALLPARAKVAALLDRLAQAQRADGR